jgi:DNA invertase Pin-like site-specific DNA recombinase
MGDLQASWALREARAAMRAGHQPLDTSTAAGKCFLDMFGVFAEFESNSRRERRLERIAKVKARGVEKRRPPIIDPGKARELKALRLC